MEKIIHLKEAYPLMDTEKKELRDKKKIKNLPAHSFSKMHETLIGIIWLRKSQAKYTKFQWL